MKPRTKRIISYSLILIVSAFVVMRIAKKTNLNTEYQVGQVLDSLNNVYVYYNGGVDNVLERNVSADGYNIGLKYQCVEFVKRYYYEHFNHKMPDSYGHAKDFFWKNLKDGKFNDKRGMNQYHNGSAMKPAADDLIVFGPSLSNSYGHVAIISEVTDRDIEIVQQNPGPFGKSRERITLKKENDRWFVDNDRVLGWLRLPQQQLD